MSCSATIKQSLLASAAGHELLFDARLVRGEHITDGSTIMAASSPNANNYTVLTPEKAAEMEAASPASLLAKSVSPRPEILNETCPFRCQKQGR